MEKIKVKVYSESYHSLPQYETDGSVGLDVKVKLDSDYDTVELRQGEVRMFHTGLYVEIPKGYELQVRPRSGLAIKYGLQVVNTPGTIDSDYRGEIMVGLCKVGTGTKEEPYAIKDGDRIAQLVLKESPQLEWVKVDSPEELSSTDRGAGGFGSTGK